MRLANTSLVDPGRLSMRTDTAKVTAGAAVRRLNLVPGPVF
jgi:hypothetical protein